MRILPFVAGAGLLGLSHASSPQASPTPSTSSQCHCLPGDSCWPSKKEWDNFNATISGRLVATVPIGTPCHDPHYDEAACAQLQSIWDIPETHVLSSSSMQEQYYVNDSCDPFTPRTRPCLLGNYVLYAVNATSVSDIQRTVRFAKQKNLRFIVRNTGHDYIGRSTGAGALSVWNLHLKDMEVSQWSSKEYSGPAIRVGAGVSGGEAVSFAGGHDLAIVTGDCATVGVAGGYTQGGGHSPLSTTFGLGADQALEYNVVTTSGDVVTASPKENEDLYWALAGGGGGTYAIVTSMLVRAHPTARTGGCAFELKRTDTTPEKFDQAVASFIKQLPDMVEKDASIPYLLTPTALSVTPITVFNSTGDYVKDIVLRAWRKELDDLGIKLNISFTTSETYLEHYIRYEGPLPGGAFSGLGIYGSRLIPTTLLTHSVDAFIDAQNKAVSEGASALSTAASFKAPPGAYANAVLPAWRNTAIALQYIVLWNETSFAANLPVQDKMINDWVAKMESLTPGSGTYLNEAAVSVKDWKQAFFGSNYDKLLAIKRKWDPDSVLYGSMLVGSDDWTVDHNGRMCRA